MIGVGGGAVLSEENMRRLKAGGCIVWLTCSADVLHERIVADESSRTLRPALTGQSGLAEVRTVLSQREPLYRLWADVCFSTEHRTPETVAADVAAWLDAAHR